MMTNKTSTESTRNERNGNDNHDRSYPQIYGKYKPKELIINDGNQGWLPKWQNRTDIDEITNTLEKPDTTAEIKELSLNMLDTCQLDALQSKTTPLNTGRFQELRDRYET